MGNRVVYFCSILLTLVISANLASRAAEPERILRAGAHIIDITPTTFPVDTAGSMSPVKAIGAHDPLYARCLVLDNGDCKIAFAVCDSCMISSEIFEAAKEKAFRETGIPSDHMIMSATHTHTAVTVTPVFQSVVDADYCEFLSDRIATGIVQATAHLEPARIGWAVGNNARQVFNRRWYLRPGVATPDPFDLGSDKIQTNPPGASEALLKPVGLIDAEVPIIAVQAIDGRPIAVLANYSLHYVGGVPAESLSADYFGEFARQISRMIKAEAEPKDASNAESASREFVAIMSNGTSGDINNSNFFESTPSQPPFEQIRVVATDVAESTYAAYKRVKYADWVPIKMQQAEIELGVRRPTRKEIADARQLLGSAGDRPYRDRRAIYANETLDLADYPETVRVKLQAIRIGDLGIVTTPCETFVETGLALKQASPLKPTFVISLANGYNGYLPTPSQHELGGYETWRAKSSYLQTDAEPKIRSKLLELLGEITKE